MKIRTEAYDPEKNELVLDVTLVTDAECACCGSTLEKYQPFASFIAAKKLFGFILCLDCAIGKLRAFAPIAEERNAESKRAFEAYMMAERGE